MRFQRPVRGLPEHAIPSECGQIGGLLTAWPEDEVEETPGKARQGAWSGRAQGKSLATALRAGYHLQGAATAKTGDVLDGTSGAQIQLESGLAATG